MTPVFVQTGKDLLLDVKEPVTLDKKSDFLWKHNVTINIVKVFGNNKPKIYKEGAESLGNYSLLLKNVQQNDSGTYNAVISAAKDKTVAEYKVTVQGKFNILNVDTQQYSVSKPFTPDFFFSFSSRSSVCS